MSCWPFLSFKRGSNWVPSFEVNQVMGLLKLISTCLHAGPSMKRELGTQPSEVGMAGKLRGCGITEGHVDPLCQLRNESEQNAGTVLHAAECANLICICSNPAQSSQCIQTPGVPPVQRLISDRAWHQMCQMK